ncbi:hypothetical protein LIER_23996 [Lithospermum erythrorhizon]|uniref:Uncharacterized protein n=1 Tax=Lithospermum erythrorhizon TaxID=34254 RepID=A0AAV3R0Y3_LITER
MACPIASSSSGSKRKSSEGDGISSSTLIFPEVYGVVVDACVEYVRIGETTAIECVQNFFEGIISIFEKDYLRRPNEEDLKRLLQIGEERGFPGMIRSINYMH